MGCEWCSEGDHSTSEANIDRKQLTDHGSYGTFTESVESEHYLKNDTDIEESVSNSGDMETPQELTENEKNRIVAGFRSACFDGIESLCEHHLSQHPNLNLLDLRFEGESALHVATKNQHLSLMQFLLQYGVSPNIQNTRNGDTPLHIATRLCLKKCVAFLCQYEADINIANQKDETALNIAVDNNYEDIIELLSPEAQTIISSYSVKDRNRNPMLDYIDQDANEDSSDVDADVGMDRGNTERRMHDEADDILKQNNLNESASDNISRTPTIWRRTKALGNERAASDRRATVPTKNLGDDQKRQLQVIKIARTNPFSKLKRANTQKALQEMEKITAEAAHLPPLRAWLEKKQSSAPHWWQKRWIMVEGSYFLWSEKMREIKNVRDTTERAKFNGNFSLMMVTEVEPIDKKTKSHRKFVMKVQDGVNNVKEYIFRAANEKDRTFWVEALNRHIDHQKEVLSFLGTKENN